MDLKDLGSDCGKVGRAVAAETKGPIFLWFYDRY